MSNIELNEQAAYLIVNRFHVSSDYARRLANAALNAIDSKGGDPSDWETIVRTVDVVVRSWIEHGLLKEAES
jgi:hypothetical protein